MQAENRQGLGLRESTTAPGVSRPNALVAMGIVALTMAATVLDA